MNEHVGAAKSVARTLALTFRKNAEGAVLVGSAITNPCSFRPVSDVDILIYTKNLPAVVETMPFFTAENAQDAYSCIRQNLIHGLASKGIHNNVLVSINILDYEAFSAIANLTVSEVVYYRRSPNAKRVLFKAFTGQSINRLLRVELFGIGYLAYEPVVLRQSGVKFLGIAPDALLAPVETVFASPSFQTQLQNLWRSAIQLAFESHPDCGTFSEATWSRMLTTSKAKREKLSKAAIDYISKKSSEIFERHCKTDLVWCPESAGCPIHRYDLLIRT